MIEENVPSDHQDDNFYERFMEQRTRDLNNPSTTDEHDSFPFPIDPLRSISSTNQPKRSSMHSNDSGIISPLASSRTTVLSPTIPAETSTPQPFSSQAAQTPHLPPRESLGPIQQFLRNSATQMARSSVKPRPKEPKYNRIWATGAGAGDGGPGRGDSGASSILTSTLTCRGLTIPCSSSEELSSKYEALSLSIL